MDQVPIDTQIETKQQAVQQAEPLALREAVQTKGPVRIQIVGAPVACAEGVKETWRDLGLYIAARLRERYGTVVEVTYHDLFDSTCPPLPADAQLPLVLVAGDVLTSGGKLSMPSIRRHLESLGIAPVGYGS